MTKVNILEAKTHLSRLLHRVESGEEVVIARGGKAVARLAPIEKGKARIPGRLKGAIQVGEDFDETLPDTFWLGED